MRAQQQYPPAWAGSPSPPGAAALELPQGEPEEGGAHRGSGSPCPPRYSTRSMCAGTGSTRPRAGAGPQHASGRRASRLQAWSLAGAVYKADGVGSLGGVRPGLTLELFTNRTSTAIRARPATPTQKENTSHMEAAILGAPPPSDP